jgi:hypothetical protein
MKGKYIYFLKKKPKLSAICNTAFECSKGIKVAPKLSKCIKNVTYFFLYSYNTPIILTNKIIK